MPNDIEEIQSMLGAIGGCLDRPVRSRSPKLNSVQPASEEAFYMLATFCFDLQRKLEYVTKATLKFEAQMDRELAQRIISENDTINAEGLTWRQRAELAETATRKLHEEIGDQHEKGLRQAARGKDR